MKSLANKKCVPCEAGTEPLTPSKYMHFTPSAPEWEVVEEKKLIRTFTFKDFKQALAFVNKVGAIAEEEGHHPNIFLFGWNKVKITLTTHVIGGLSVNDFILASKINVLK